MRLALLVVSAALAGAIIVDRHNARLFSAWLNDPETRDWLLKVWGVEREQHQFTWTYPNGTVTVPNTTVWSGTHQQ